MLLKETQSTIDIQDLLLKAKCVSLEQIPKGISENYKVLPDILEHLERMFSVQSINV